MPWKLLKQRSRQEPKTLNAVSPTGSILSLSKDVRSTDCQTANDSRQTS